MSGHLCLKWNNHSSAFLRSISSIQIKERFCDATIACQGKYFPVHRIILSTCSEYFEEIFERMQCQHPYIIFKDIEPAEMELLLNYMYQGEVNVVQEKLPSLIKTAEALRVKGLAVPDDLPTNKETSGKKRSSNEENVQPKKRLDDKRKRENNVPSRNVQTSEAELSRKSNGEEIVSADCSLDEKVAFNHPIKEEPAESVLYEDNVSSHESSFSQHTGDTPKNERENVFINFASSEDSTMCCVKSEELIPTHQLFPEQNPVTPWLGTTTAIPNLSSGEGSLHGNMVALPPGWKSALEPETEPRTSSTLAIATGEEAGSNVATERDHRCSLCSYVGSNLSTLRKHIRFTHWKQKPYSCTLCLFRTSLRKDLARHMRIHTGEKPFGCPYCFRRFSQKSSLKTHLKKKYSCFKLPLRRGGEDRQALEYGSSSDL